MASLSGRLSVKFKSCPTFPQNTFQDQRNDDNSVKLFKKRALCDTSSLTCDTPPLGAQGETRSSVQEVQKFWQIKYMSVHLCHRSIHVTHEHISDTVSEEVIASP